MRCAVGAGSTVSEEGDFNFESGVICAIEVGLFLSWRWPFSPNLGG